MLVIWAIFLYTRKIRPSGKHPLAYDKKERGWQSKELMRQHVIDEGRSGKYRRKSLTNGRKSTKSSTNPFSNVSMFKIRGCKMESKEYVT